MPLSLRGYRLSWIAATAVLAVVTTFASAARADDDCPLGSTQKSENGSTWCEPSVCDSDAQCLTGQLCRLVPLCVEIGVLKGTAPGGSAAASAADAGSRLMARQRCGEAKACPQNTTCSEKSRCITRAQAERAGLLTTTASPAEQASASAAAPGEPPKKACGCAVPGARLAAPGIPSLAVLALVIAATRRRGRRSSR